MKGKIDEHNLIEIRLSSSELENIHATYQQDRQGELSYKREKVNATHHGHTEVIIMKNVDNYVKGKTDEHKKKNKRRGEHYQRNNAYQRKTNKRNSDQGGNYQTSWRRPVLSIGGTYTIIKRRRS